MCSLVARLGSTEVTYQRKSKPIEMLPGSTSRLGNTATMLIPLWVSSKLNSEHLVGKVASNQKPK